MRDADRRYQRESVDAVRREGDRLDQGTGQCPHVQPGEPPCPGCFFNGGGSDADR